METVYTSVITVVMTLLARELLPAIKDFLTSFRADNRKAGADDRKAKKEDAELEDARDATTIDGWKELSAHWQAQAERADEENKRERTECREQMQTLTNRLTTAEIKLGRAEVIIEHLREKLGIRADGSDVHRSLPAPPPDAPPKRKGG